MAVELGEAVPVGIGAFRVEWTVTPAASVRVFQNGELITSGLLTEWVFTVTPGGSLFVEVLDDPNQVPLAWYDDRAMLVWEGDADVAKYRIEEFIDAAWTTRQTVENLGEPWFRWRTRRLEDEATHQFRVTPIGLQGAEAEPELFTATMARYPDRPDVTWSYDDGAGELTIA